MRYPSPVSASTSVALCACRGGHGSSDGDGDALDAGESRTWWSGAIPGGGSAQSLGALTRTPDGTVYVAELDGTPASHIYKLVDTNNNGNADDPGEATVVTQLPTGVYT